jgi:hypothetical protein
VGANVARASPIPISGFSIELGGVIMALPFLKGMISEISFLEIQKTEVSSEMARPFLRYPHFK